MWASWMQVSSGWYLLMETLKKIQQSNKKKIEIWSEQLIKINNQGFQCVKHWLVVFACTNKHLSDTIWSVLRLSHFINVVKLQHILSEQGLNSRIAALTMGGRLQKWPSDHQNWAQNKTEKEEYGLSGISHRINRLLLLNWRESEMKHTRLRL